MSVTQEVKDIISEAAGLPAAKAKENIDMAIRELTRIMTVSGDTLFKICTKAEAAVTGSEAKAVFKQLNSLMRILLEAAPGLEHDRLLRQALETIKVSEKFALAVSTATTIKNAIREYKVGILQRLARSIRQRELLQRQDDEMDAELFSTFLPEPRSPLSETERIIKAPDRGTAKKRGIAEVAVLPRLLKKPRVPEVATVEEVLAVSGDDISTSKKILLTREKLRAGLNSPKGLLDLVGSSTSALDRTKRLELLKGAGMSFKGPRSFSDRLNAAIQRLDLGLGGHTMEDTLLFGAKVMSCPGTLSKKNITDVENNLINGATTWKHQNMYAKMMIAGCMNQSKRIFEKFDKILYGQMPENLIKETHVTIRGLLNSKEGTDFLAANCDEMPAVGDKDDNFIKKIIEAVSPIIPITLRNKDLDGSYMRTALLLLEAAELLFSKYERDIRELANPNGMVGMAESMHAEFKRSAFYNEELRPVQEFARDLQTQYQTSMGMGSPFAKDVLARGRKRSKPYRGRGGFFAARNRYQGWSRFQQAQQDPFTVVAGMGPQVPAGRGQSGLLAMRQQGICYDYRAGTCMRGGACRYRHANQ